MTSGAVAGTTAGANRGEAPFVRLPDPATVFEARACRFEALAGGHALGDYLSLMAGLVTAQARAVGALAPLIKAVDPSLAQECLAAGQPVIPAAAWRRDPVWRQGLDVILGHMSSSEAARSAVQELGLASGDDLDRLAASILSGDVTGAHPAKSPLVAAALQVYWSVLASRLDASLFEEGTFAETGACPVCGSAPVASVVHSGGSRHGLRYLHCSLCESEWHMTRVQCSSCGKTTDLDYFAIEGGSEVVKAEACASCSSYLKQMYADKDSWVDPVADDLATLALDMLMAERGQLRSGPNLLFIPGEETTEA